MGLTEDADNVRMQPVVDETRGMNKEQLEVWFGNVMNSMTAQQRYATRLSFMAGSHIMSEDPFNSGLVTNARGAFSKLFLNAEQDNSLGTLVQCDIDFATEYTETPTDTD